MAVLRNIAPEEFSAKYIFEYLCSIIFRTYLERYLGGTNINNINFPLVGKLPILVPVNNNNNKVDKDKQEKIADNIYSIRKKAQILREQAKLSIEQAKREVENILLGGENYEA